MSAYAVHIHIDNYASNENSVRILEHAYNCKNNSPDKKLNEMKIID